MKQLLVFTENEHRMIVSAMEGNRNRMKGIARQWFNITLKKVRATNHVFLDGGEMKFVIWALEKRIDILKAIGRHDDRSDYIELHEKVKDYFRSFQWQNAPQIIKAVRTHSDELQTIQPNEKEVGLQNG